MHDGQNSRYYWLFFVFISMIVISANTQADNNYRISIVTNFFTYCHQDPDSEKYETYSWMILVFPQSSLFHILLKWGTVKNISYYILEN